MRHSGNDQFSVDHILERWRPHLTPPEPFEGYVESPARGHFSRAIVGSNSPSDTATAWTGSQAGRPWRRISASPTRPKPNSVNVPGSGTAWVAMPRRL